MKVRAVQSAAVFLKDGEAVQVTEGQLFDRGEPVVRQNKWLFVDYIEQATAAPGEAR